MSMKEAKIMKIKSMFNLTEGLYSTDDKKNEFAKLTAKESSEKIFKNLSFIK